MDPRIHCLISAHPSLARALTLEAGEDNPPCLHLGEVRLPPKKFSIDLLTRYSRVFRDADRARKQGVRIVVRYYRLVILSNATTTGSGVFDTLIRANRVDIRKITIIPDLTGATETSVVDGCLDIANAWVTAYGEDDDHLARPKTPMSVRITARGDVRLIDPASKA